MGYYGGEFIIYSETSEYLVTRVMRMVPDDRRRGQTRSSEVTLSTLRLVAEFEGDFLSLHLDLLTILITTP
jgi:hypothetical protein